MHRLYTITASPCPRLLARVVQLFDQQLLAPDALSFVHGAEQLSIQIIVECEAPLAERLVAKLYHLQSIQSVTLADMRSSQTEA